MIYRNRSDAGRRLAKELARYASEKPIILALPRGGVVVAAEIADALAVPLDLLLVRKIGVPFQPELAMGAVVDGGHPHVIRNEDIIALADISADDFNRVCQSELAEIERRRKLYLADRPRADVEDRIASNRMSRSMQSGFTTTISIRLPIAKSSPSCRRGALLRKRKRSG